MSVQITAQFPDLSRAVRKAAARKIEERANRYGQRMVEAVQRSIRAQLNVHRTGSRRRSPGSQHLDEGWDYQVAGDPTTYPLFVNLTASGDGAFMRRIDMMDAGTPGHFIAPRNRTKLRYPTGDGASPGPPWIYSSEGVSHPGTQGKHFLEAARNFAVGSAARDFR